MWAPFGNPKNVPKPKPRFFIDSGWILIARWLTLGLLLVPVGSLLEASCYIVVFIFYVQNLRAIYLM